MRNFKKELGRLGISPTYRTASPCTDCGGPRSRFSYSEGRCRQCYQLPESPYLANYKFYLKRLTPQQKQRFKNLMQTRRGLTAKAEAIDLIMREPSPGICCSKCATLPPDCGPDIHGLQSSWLRLVEALEMLCAE